MVRNLSMQRWDLWPSQIRQLPRSGSDEIFVRVYTCKKDTLAKLGPVHHFGTKRSERLRCKLVWVGRTRLVSKTGQRLLTNSVDSFHVGPRPLFRPSEPVSLHYWYDPDKNYCFREVVTATHSATWENEVVTGRGWRGPWRTWRLNWYRWQKASYLDWVRIFRLRSETAPAETSMDQGNSREKSEFHSNAWSQLYLQGQLSFERILLWRSGPQIGGCSCTSTLILRRRFFAIVETLTRYYSMW